MIENRQQTAAHDRYWDTGLTPYDDHRPPQLDPGRFDEFVPPSTEQPQCGHGKPLADDCDDCEEWANRMIDDAIERDRGE